MPHEKFAELLEVGDRVGLERMQPHIGNFFLRSLERCDISRDLLPHINLEWFGSNLCDPTGQWSCHIFPS